MKRIYIEITNICNMSCSFCSGTNRIKKSMTVQDFRLIASEIAPLGVQIYLHVLGEPLLHKDIKSILDVASEYKLPVNITTNGTLIKNNSDMLMSHSAVRKVNISVHSLEGKTVSECDEYLKEITDFGIMCRESGSPIVNYRMWSGDVGGSISVEDSHELDYIIDAFNVVVDDNFDRGFLSKKLADNVYVCHDKKFVWPNVAHEEISKYGKCLGGRDMLAILVDGTVVPCCLDSNGVVSLGNIFKDKLSDIMSSTRYRLLVEGFKGKTISEELCRRCAFRCRFDKKRSAK